MKNETMLRKMALGFLLSALLSGCVWLGNMHSKYIATVPQSAGVQEVDKTLDVFGGEHEIMFVFHGYDCSAPLPGHADIEVSTLAGKKLASASFPLKELTISGVGAIKTEEERREDWLEEQRRCKNREGCKRNNENRDDVEKEQVKCEELDWQKMWEAKQKMVKDLQETCQRYPPQLGYLRREDWTRPLEFPGYSTVRVRARIHGFQGSGVGNMEIWSAYDMFMPPKKPQKTLEQK